MISRKAVTWAVLICAAVVAFLLLVHWWNGLTAWLPWSAESRLERQTARADREASNGAARGLEVEGERDQAARTDTFHRQVIEVHTITAEAVSQARSATDADQLLPADRLDRLRHHDGELCALSPASCAGRAPDTGDAGGG